MTPAFPWENPLSSYVDPTYARLWRIQNAISENMPRAFAQIVGANAAPASGTLYLAGGHVLRAGQAARSISFVSGSVAAVTPANQWFCIVDVATLALLAITVDDGATAWGTGTVKTLAIASPYTPVQDQAVYAGVMQNAATPANLSAIGSRATLTGLTPIEAGNSSAGLTNPASCPNPVGAVGAAGTIPWSAILSV